jgi:hypothetical protein
MQRALIIDEPWIEMILCGKKIWEMRTRPTRNRGMIGLIRKGSGLIVGTAQLVDCLPPLDEARYRATESFHGITGVQQARAIGGKWVVPWILQNAAPLDPPVPYMHRRGAVTFVLLETSVVDAVLAQASAGSSNPMSPASERDVGGRAGHRVGVAAIARPEHHGGVVRLTRANIRYDHIYLRSIEHLFPSDAVGGSSKHRRAKRLLTVVFEPGAAIQTDYDGAKQIFRERAAVREFFRATGAKEGDYVSVTRTGPYEYRVNIVSRRGDDESRSSIAGRA